MIENVEIGKTYCQLERPDFILSAHAKVVDIHDEEVTFVPISTDGGRTKKEDEEPITCSLKEFQQWAKSEVI